MDVLDDALHKAMRKTLKTACRQAERRLGDGTTILVLFAVPNSAGLRLGVAGNQHRKERLALLKEAVRMEEEHNNDPA